MRYHLTLKSSNSKTGPIPVSTSPRTTCPACPFKGSGCYADGGPIALHWDAVTSGKRGDAWHVFVGRIAALPEGQLWRHNQAGDLPGVGDDLDSVALLQLVDANSGRRGFTYTHKPLTAKNASAIKEANARGFTVNLSANNLEHADELAAAAVGPVAVVLPSEQTTNTTTPKGRKVVVCPATQREDVSCATCQMCARQRDVIIGFPAHGARVKRANEVVRIYRRGKA